MDIILYAKNLDITPSIRTYIEDKVGSIKRLLSDKQNNSVQIRVEISKPSKHHRSGAVYYAEVNIKLGSKLYRGTAEHSDVRTALDEVRDEIKRQLRKDKTKRMSKERRSR